MKFKRIISFLIGAVMFSVCSFTVSAEENKICLYKGEASAPAWTCPVTIPVTDRSIYSEENTIAISCETETAPYFVLTSNSGGKEWTQVLPDDFDENYYYYSYTAMTESFGTDFALLDYISVMASDSPVTVYEIDMLIGKQENDTPTDNVTHDSRVVGYLPDWDYKSYGEVDFSALTHLNIAFCNPDEQGNISCYIPDYEMTNIVNKAHSNDVKVFAALGGGGGCDGYLSLIDTPEEMTAFNDKIMEYCKKYNLDGIDLDIELGSSHKIWNYYADWVDSLRVLCDENGYEMSTATAGWVAVNVSSETFNKFDFLNVMGYDNDGDEISHADMEFAESSIKYFNIQKKVPKDKLVLGVPFYGRGYTADGKLDWNSYVPFKELIELDKDNYNSDFYNGIAYNGAATMREKCAMAREYGGIMIWELSQDAKGEYSLLSLIKEELTSKLIGDVNADGVFDVADVVMLQKYILQSADLTNPQAAEVTGDNTVDIFDIVVLKKQLISA